MTDGVRPDLHAGVGQRAYLRPDEELLLPFGHARRGILRAEARNDEEGRLLSSLEEPREDLRRRVDIAVVEGEHHRVARQLAAVLRVEDLAQRHRVESGRLEEVQLRVQLLGCDGQRIRVAAD